LYAFSIDTLFTSRSHSLLRIQFTLKWRLLLSVHSLMSLVFLIKTLHIFFLNFLLIILLLSLLFHHLTQLLLRLLAWLAVISALECHLRQSRAHYNLQIGIVDTDTHFFSSLKDQCGWYVWIILMFKKLQDLLLWPSL
jgi:hypothetical protein